ncbi:hypothetical protein VSS37_03430 [Candidatus Thiothrix sp. Deng01]|uniref:Uncharacterized protein n=1 Tax=Candidatus Thiothrix phosphatis TaxID=3112415 RepID=A0ABU6CT58_9GAMM|nr:hypothetical protein [Candidatus Thiothrix sp. Deng01]MEB4590022.1 hypothetical protein [Candidatus Thiothrix sp. Deng01]
MKIQTQQLGRIAFDADFISQKPEQVADFFSAIRFLPYRIEPIIQNGTVDYMGYSSAFAEVSTGSLIPRYTANIEHCTVEKEGLNFTKVVSAHG